jgi:hypothetical protein
MKKMTMMMTQLVLGYSWMPCLSPAPLVLPPQQLAQTVGLARIQTAPAEPSGCRNL